MKKSKPEAKKYELVIRGNPNYINRMDRHLREEHPSTKKRMAKFRVM